MWSQTSPKLRLPLSINICLEGRTPENDTVLLQRLYTVYVDYFMSLCLVGFGVLLVIAIVVLPIGMIAVGEPN